MNAWFVSMLARIHACNARVAAMQAENQNRADQGMPPAYVFDQFWEEAVYLEQIADELRDCGHG